MKKHREKPPHFAECLLKRFVPPGVAGASILGDVREEYLERVQSHSAFSAAVSYWLSVVSICFHFRRRSRKQDARTGNRRQSRPLFEVLGDELRLGVRSLLHKSVFSVTVIATIGLAIAANTSVFSILYGVLLKPLPYPDSDRLIDVFRVIPSLMGENPTNAQVSGWHAVPYAVFLDWSEHSAVFESCGAYEPTRLTIVRGDESQTIPSARVTAGVFSALKITPLIGRTLMPEDDPVGRPARIVLSYGFWQRHFGGDPKVIGQPLTTGEASYEISGIMPKNFGFPSHETQLWITFDDQRKSSMLRKGGYLQVIARLKPGVPISGAQAHMEEVYHRIKEDHPEDKEFGIRVISSQEIAGAEMRPSLFLLMGAVGTVLLIACTNIANLTLVRMSERRREYGLRQALGEGRGRLMIHLWTECLLLSFCGGALGAALAATVLKTVIAMFPTPIPRANEISLDYVVLLFTLGLSLAVGMIMGILPAIRSMRTSVMESLVEISRSSAGTRHRSRAHSILVASEVALAFILLACTGLFIRSLSNLMTVEPGFITKDLLVTRIAMPGTTSPSAEKVQTFYRDLSQKLGAVPGVHAVGSASQMPFVGGLSFPSTTIETSTGEVEVAVHAATVSPSFFQALGVPLVSGRPFSEADRIGAPLVAVVNQSLAGRFWPGQDPLGRRLRINATDQPPWIQVVGVVHDFLYQIQGAPFPAIYVPFAQYPGSPMMIVMRASVPAINVIPPVRRIFMKIDRNMPIQISVLEDRIQQSDALINGRFVTIVLGSMAVAAGLLAILGIYGVLAYTVTQRTREIGIRIAIGADNRSVLRNVLFRGLVMAAVGLFFGVLGSLGVTSLLRSMLFGVHPNDPATLATAIVIIFVAAALAGYLPARRATKVDPISVLRCE